MFNHEPENYDCPFCKVGSGEETELNKLSDIVYETETVVAYVSPKWWVNNLGNVIVIPRFHVENIYDIETELLSDIYSAARKVALGMKNVYKCDGTSFRQHNEPAGNQEIWHFHVHVFPRWNNDELYKNHNNTDWVTATEKASYAKKLRSYFSK